MAMKAGHGKDNPPVAQASNLHLNDQPWPSPEELGYLQDLARLNERELA
jgi:hypothetical protein